MFGFLVGTACLVGAIHVMRRRRCAAQGGCGRDGWGGWGSYGGWGRHRGWGWGDGGGDSHPRNPWWLRGLFARLDTTPGQEKVIREVLADLQTDGQSLRGEFRKARTDLASALRGETVDETALGEAFARHDEALEHMRKGVVGALSKLHDALDERQRRLLAEWLESGRRGAGPHRGAYADGGML